MTYHEILAVFKARHAAVTAVIFCDSEGETIDYVSDVDSYHTQLLGAYHSEMMARLHDIATQAGSLVQVDLRTSSSVMSLIPVYGEFYLVLLAKRGAVVPASALRDVVRALEAEM